MPHVHVSMHITSVTPLACYTPRKEVFADTTFTKFTIDPLVVDENSPIVSLHTNGFDDLDTIIDGGFKASMSSISTLVIGWGFT